MKILVCSKISIPAKDRTLPAWVYLRGLGHEVVVEHPENASTISQGFEPDVLISMGVSIMEETFEAVKRFPKAKLFTYNWDVYKWVWDNPRPGEYDYKRYGELLKLATEIWVPSVCTGKRTTQWYGLGNWEVILSSCPWWEYPKNQIQDGGYALCTLRKIPDPWCDMFEKGCEEVGIPYFRPDHSLPYDEYQKMVANCRFLVNHYYEASTGGLTLMEGYYHGKPCLCSDSEWNGAKDYMGDRANYFKYGDFNSFKQELKLMNESPRTLNLNSHSDEECKKWVVENFSDLRMVQDMLTRMEYYQGVS